MKLVSKLFLVVGILSVGFVQSPARADVAPALNVEQLATITINSAMDLINWKVGDSANYNVSLGFMGNGTMTKAVSKEEGAAIWLHEEINVAGQNQVVDALINRADAKILKFIVNGKEQAPPSDKPEIISQDYTEVTVPAGTFKAIHIVAKTQQVSKMEIWANPRDTVMDGTVKQVAEMNMITMTTELTSFHKN